MEVQWPFGTEKSMPDCRLAEFRIRPILSYGKVVRARKSRPIYKRMTVYRGTGLGRFHCISIGAF